MDRFRNYSFRLKPTEDQEALLLQTAGVCRLIWNLALEQRTIWGKAHKITSAAQHRELKDLRAEFDWIASVSQSAQQQTINDLDKAFVSFFSRRAGFPRQRIKGADDSFRFRGREVSFRRLNKRWSEVKLPKMGWVRFRDTRRLTGEVRNVTVLRSPVGWRISVMCRSETATQSRRPGTVGIDRGVAVPAMLSTGERFALPSSLSRLEAAHRRAQRVVARRKKGSKRHYLAARRAMMVKAKAARVRAHWQHQTSTWVAERFGTVVIERLHVSSMTRSARGTHEKPGRNVRAKASLNRAILNVGWFGLQQKLAYKLMDRGGELRQVDPRYTSQTCSECGSIDGRSRESQARFVCVHCGAALNADHNAAINIERRGNAPSLGVEAGRMAWPAKRQPLKVA